jgi:hypothetical protein
MKEFNIDNIINTNNNSLKFINDPTPPATKLVIVFNGMGFTKITESLLKYNKLHNPSSEQNIYNNINVSNPTISIFEFYKGLSTPELLVDFDSLFLADFNKFMYMRGLKDITENPEETTDLLIQFINRKNYTKIYLLGNCMGGNHALYQTSAIKKRLNNIETSVTDIKTLVFNGFIRMDDFGYYHKWIEPKITNEEIKYTNTVNLIEEIDNSISPKTSIKFISDENNRFVNQPSLITNFSNIGEENVIHVVKQVDNHYYDEKINQQLTAYLKSKGMLSGILNEFLELN